MIINWKSKAFSFLLLICLIGVQDMQAEGTLEKDYFKKIIKEFNIGQNQTVSITNKYGQVSVDAWDSDRVQFSVEIVVDARNEKKANEIYDRISIKFMESDDVLSAITEIEASNSWSWFGGGASSDFSINYTVKMPAQNPLMVANKYGDCKVREISSKGTFFIKFGDLHVYDNMEEMNLEIAYGTAKIQDHISADVNLKYAHLYSGNFEQLSVNSKYSHVQTKDVGDLVIRSKFDDYVLGRVSTMTNRGKYDDFHIEEVSELKLTSVYSDFEVGTLHHFADINMRYGEFILEELDSRFRNFKIEGQYSDFALGTDGLESFDLDLNGEHVDWEWPGEMSELKNSKNGNSKSFSGYLEKQNTGRVIQANLKYGSFVLK